jgi:hypothetical protein
VFENLLPKDPGKRDLTILALIVVPLMVVGVIWGILGEFDDSGSVATPVPSPSVEVESTPSSGTPAALFVIEGA